MSSRKFTTSDRDNFPLQILGFSTFWVHHAWFSGVKDGDAVCQGVDAVQNGELKKCLVNTVSTYIVTITLEKFFSDAVNLVAASNHEILLCSSGRCPGEMHAYIWISYPMPSVPTV